MRLHAGLPIRMWGECVLAVVQIINLLPSSVINLKVPYEVLFKKKADYDHLIEVCCLCYDKRFQPKRDKFVIQTCKCVFIGYPTG